MLFYIKIFIISGTLLICFMINSYINDDDDGDDDDNGDDDDDDDDDCGDDDDG